jgi:uncharacterized protein YjdB
MMCQHTGLSASVYAPMRIRHPVVLALAALLAAACSSDSTGAGDVLVVSEIEITPPGAGLVIGATQQLQATPKTASGITVPNRPVTWLSDDPDIATVSETGLVTAVALGETRIAATVDDVTERVAVNVSPKPVATVDVEPETISIQAGQTRQLSATVKAADGQTLTGRTVQFESEDVEVATVSSTGLVTGVSAGQTRIRAISEGKEAHAAVTVTPRPAVRLAFSTQPANGIAGAALDPVRVAIQDETGATATTATNAVTIALDDNPANATLSGTRTVNAVAGIATFSDLRISRPGTGYRLSATSGELTPATSNTFAVVSGPPAAMTITTQPSSTATSGAVFGRQPVIQLEDREGNNAAVAGIRVTATLVGSGGTLGGTTTIETDAAGAARFSNLRISGGSGDFQLRFSAPDLPAVTSATISVGPAGIAIATQPSSSASSGTPLDRQPVIELVDASGNRIPQGGVSVSVSLTGGGTLTGSTSATTDGSGLARFSGLTITGTPGTYRLVFSASGVASVTSDPIELGPGAPDELRVAVQPSDAAVSGLPFLVQPQVQLHDAQGTPVPLAGVPVTAELASGDGTLSGTLTVDTDGSGRAAFTNLRISGSGVHTIRFTAPDIGSVVSDEITVILDVGSDGLAVVVQPSATARSGKVLQQQPVLELQDATGAARPIAGIRVLASLIGDGQLDGRQEIPTNELGRAEFTNLRINGVGAFRLRFTANDLPPVESNVIQVEQ